MEPFSFAYLLEPFQYGYMTNAMWVSALVGGVLRHFTISDQTLHTDGDQRTVTILTDDERPFVQYGDEVQTREARD